jgi:Putative rhamnosyl transferase
MLATIRQEIINSGSESIVSIRLDSDDALDRRFTAAIAGHEKAFLASAHRRWLLNFPLGYKLHVVKNVIVESEMLNSPFHALFEHAQRPLTALGGNHTNLHETIPVHHDYSIHGWLQVLHGGNLRNRVKASDKPITDVDLRKRFGITAVGNPDYFDQLPPAAGERLADELDSD